MLRDEVDHQVQRGEHPQAEQVELHQPGGRAVVLVPLEHGPVLHAGPLDRAELHQRPVGHDHATGVDAEVAGEVEHLPGEVEDERRHRRPFGLHALERADVPPPPVDPLREPVGVAG